MRFIGVRRGFEDFRIPQDMGVAMGESVGIKQGESIGAIWVKEGKAGEFLSIQMTGDDGAKTSFIAFKNKYKREGENTPDYRIFRRLEN